MNRMLLRRLTLVSLHHFNATSSIHSSNPSISISNKLLRLPTFSPCSIFLHFSSHSSLPPSPPKPSADDTLADVSTEELMNRIKKYEEGDNEAIPSIFEAILARRISGKHEDTDDELMENFRSKRLQDGDQQLLSDEDDQTDYETSSDEDFTDSDEDYSD